MAKKIKPAFQVPKGAELETETTVEEKTEPRKCPRCGKGLLQPIGSGNAAYREVRCAECGYTEKQTQWRRKYHDTSPKGE